MRRFTSNLWFCSNCIYENFKNKKRDKSKKEDLSRCVPRVGIEPTLLAEPDFESGASTNSATEALCQLVSDAALLLLTNT